MHVINYFLRLIIFEYGKKCVMIATKQMDVRANIKKYFDMAFNGDCIT